MTERTIEALRDRIERDFPYPIARPFYLLRDLPPSEWRGRLMPICNFVGDIAQFLCSVALINYVHSPAAQPQLVDEIKESLRRKLTYGRWIGLLRDTIAASGSLTNPFMPELYERFQSKRKKRTSAIYPLLETVVNLRNVLDKENQSLETFQQFETALIELVEQLDFLPDYQLISVEHSRLERGIKSHQCHEFRGSADRPRSISLTLDVDLIQRHALLYNPASGRTLSLYPFYAVDPNGDPVRLQQFSYLRSNEIEYLCADKTVKIRDPFAATDLQELLSRVAGRTVTSSFASPRDAFVSFLDQTFEPLVRNPQLTRVIGEMLVARLQSEEQQIRARLLSPFSLVLIGEFKHGKSTLVNALLGADVVSTDVLPETVFVTEVTHGPHASVQAHLRNGTVMELQPQPQRNEELLAALSEQMGHAPLSVTPGTLSVLQLTQLLGEHCTPVQLGAIAAALEQPINPDPALSHAERVRDLILTLHRLGRLSQLLAVCRSVVPALPLPRGPEPSLPLSGLSRRHREIAAQVSHVAVQTPATWLAGVRLVDTPGTQRSAWHTDQVLSYLPRADAIIFLIKASAPFSQTERDFLTHAVRQYEIAKVFFVVNRLDDIKSPVAARRQLSLIEARVQTVAPGAQVFGISALAELQRLTDQPRELSDAWAAELDAGFAAFREALAQTMSVNREMIQLNRAMLETERVVAGLEVQVGLMQQAAAQTRQQRQRTLAELTAPESALARALIQSRAALQQQVHGLAAVTQGWLAPLFGRLAATAIPALTNLRASEVLEHVQFFLADTLRDAVLRCLDAQHPQLLRWLSQTRDAIEQAIAGVIRLPGGDADRGVTGGVLRAEDAWTDLDALNAVVEQAIGRMQQLALQITLQITEQLNHARKRPEQERVRTYQDQLLAHLPELQGGIATEITVLYQDLAAAIDAQISAAITQRQSEAVAVLQQAESIGEQEPAAAAIAHAEFQAVLLLIAEVRDVLHAQLERFSERG